MKRLDKMSTIHAAYHIEHMPSPAWAASSTSLAIGYACTHPKSWSDLPHFSMLKYQIEAIKLPLKKFKLPVGGVSLQKKYMYNCMVASYLFCIVVAWLLVCSYQFSLMFSTYCFRWLPPKSLYNCLIASFFSCLFDD